MAEETNMSQIAGERRDYVTRLSSKDYHKSMVEKFGDRYLQYRRDWDRSGKGEYLPFFPIQIDLEIIDYCNLKCIMCPRSIARGSGTRLPLAVFKKVIDEGQQNGLRAIEFGYGDEPLLNKNLLKMIGYANLKGIMDIRLGTNGTLLNREFSQQLLTSGLTYISVSVDAASPQTYKRIRGGDLNKLENNINTFLDMLAKSGGTLPVVRVSFVAMPENMQEIDEFVAKWSRLVSFIDIQDYIELKKLSTAFDLEHPPEGYVCFQPWQRIAINSQGNVYPCCTFQGHELPIGNIYKHTIAECWNSEQMRNLREQLLTKNLPLACQYCYASRKRLYKLPKRHKLEKKLLRKVAGGEGFQ